MKPAQRSIPGAIDHLGVIGRDMAAMTAAYRRLGFAPTDPVPLMGEQDGVAVPLGQDSAHLIFAGSYVELSGVTSQDPGHHLAPWLARRNGLHILALASADAEESRKALAASGLDCPPVQNASRHVDYGSNHGEARFHWFEIPDALGEEGFVCVVEQVTPELVFQPPESGHPNGAMGVKGVTVLAGNADAALARYASLPGADSESTSRLRFGNQTLDVLGKAALVQRYDNAGSINPPALAGFTVTVKDLEATRAWLKSANVSVHTNDQGEVWVGPENACGAIVIFAEP